jgi:hypothetical protein
MALFEREDRNFGSDAATRALSVTAVETTSSSRSTRIWPTSTTSSSVRPCIPGASRRWSTWVSGPAIAYSRWASVRASTPPCIPATVTLPASTSRPACSRRPASGWRASSLTNVRLLEMDAAQPHLSRRGLRYRLCAVSGERGARSGPGSAGNAPGLPARRQDHHPQPLPQPESGAVVVRGGRSAPSRCTSASSRTSTCRRSWRRPISSPCRSKR